MLRLSEQQCLQDRQVEMSKYQLQVEPKWFRKNSRDQTEIMKAWILTWFEGPENSDNLLTIELFQQKQTCFRFRKLLESFQHSDLVLSFHRLLVAERCLHRKVVKAGFPAPHNGQSSTETWTISVCGSSCFLVYKWFEQVAVILPGYVNCQWRMLWMLWTLVLQ